MAHAGFPRQAATTTATLSPSTVISMPSPRTNEQRDVRVRFDPGYFKTVPGIVKIAQISLCLLGFICIQVSLNRASPSGKFYSWLVMIAVTSTGTLLVLYAFHVVEKYQHKVPFLKIEFALCGLLSFFFLVVSSMTITAWDSAFIAAGSFGYRITAAYGVDFYLKWGPVFRGSLAQEPRIEYQLPPAENIPVIAVIGSSTV